MCRPRIRKIRLQYGPNLPPMTVWAIFLNGGIADWHPTWAKALRAATTT